MGGQANNPFEAGRRLIRPLIEIDQKCCVEIVLAISAGQNMSSFWNTISRDAETFADLLRNAVLRKLGERFVKLRIRIIAYGDFYMDECAMWCSTFFEIPRDEEKMAEFLWSIEPEGGGEKKSGMEALLCAMHSPWSRRTGDRRHIIALITDSEAYIPEEPLRRIDREYEERVKTYLPREYVPMPETLEEMRRLWRDGVGKMDNWKHRLLLIAPEIEPWRHMTDWDETRMVIKDEKQVRRLGMAELVSLLTELI